MRQTDHSLEAVLQALEPQRLARTLGTLNVQRISRKIAPRRSAVAAILRAGDTGPEILLMKRIERPGDRWSGQISMPGGMAQDGDADMLATAVRETKEEVGIDLDVFATRVGRLSDQVAVAKGKRLRMAIEPFVFWLHGSPSLALGPEAQLAFWLPVHATVNGQLDGVKTWRMGAISKQLPAWHVDGHVVWGLTHRMLTTLFEVSGLTTGQGGFRWPMA